MSLVIVYFYVILGDRDDVSEINTGYICFSDELNAAKIVPNLKVFDCLEL